jgi:sulfur carrier protein ThiS
MNKGYDFSVVTLNGKKMRIFNTKTVTLTDLLTSAGYDSSQIIGRSGRNLTYTLDGENRVVRGELSTPAEIALNGRPVPISTAVRQGDKVSFTPAVSGKDAALKISDLPEFAGGKTFLKDGVPLEGGYMLKAGDVIVTSAPPGESPSVLREIPAPASVAPNEKTGGLTEPAARFDVTLNGKAVSLEHKPGSDTREFIELLPLADVDLDNPPPSGVLTMLLNGEDAGFMSPVKPGDDAVIKWADK